MGRLGGVAYAFLLICAALVWAPPAAAQSGPAVEGRPVTFRFTNGMMFDLPPGWRFSDLAARGVTFHHGTGKEALEAGNRVKFTLSAPLTRDARLGENWVRVDRRGNQALPGGGKVEWYAGTRYLDDESAHYGFAALIELNYAYLATSLLTSRAAVSPEQTEQAVLAIARSLRRAERSQVLYHPTGMQAPAPSEQWFLRSSEGALRLGCFQAYCGADSNAWIYAYPSSTAFATDDAALADITGHFAKEGLAIGPTRRLDLEDGVLMWTEQPGGKQPLLGIVRRGGKHYFVSAFDTGAGRAGLGPLRPHFLLLGAGLRPWDGR